MDFLKKTWDIALDIMFPPLCINCRYALCSKTEKENLLCSVCFNGIEIYKTVFRVDKNLALAAIASYSDDSMRSLVHYLKYEGFLAAKNPLAKVIRNYLDFIPIKKLLPPEIIIIPIPLHKKRLRKRGFNQSEILADIISAQLDIPSKTDILKRIIDTPQQMTMKNSEARRNNLKNSLLFAEGERNYIKNKSIILVDDVYTSGSTMQEAAKTLRRAGAKNILGFVVAKAN